MIEFIDKINGVVIWIVVFVSLYLAIVWLSFLYLYESKKISGIVFPSVTIAIPAYNEEESIAKTIYSVAALEYPKEKLEIIVVNDGSKDGTQKAAKAAINDIKSKNPQLKIQLISQDNAGKGAALNKALDETKTDFFGVVDADSVVKEDSLKLMMQCFDDKKTAGVISALQVNNPKNIYEKVQWLEYIIGILTRRLMAFIGTLASTPGVLSIYRTDIIKKIGGFDTETKTEDFEIAMRLKYRGYSIEIEKDAYSYTNVPNNFKDLWHQRIRWYRGFIEHNIKYKEMMMNKKYDSFGWFQMPLNVIGIVLLIAAILVMIYGTVIYINDQVTRTLLINDYLRTYLFSFTTPRDYLLGLNMRIMLPVYIALGITIILFYVAHKSLNTKIKYPISIFAYFFIMPTLYFMHWVTSIGQETFKIKKKW